MIEEWIDRLKMEKEGWLDMIEEGSKSVRNGT